MNHPEDSVFTTATQPVPGAVGNSRAVVFYDGGCPLCRREIAHYQRLAGARNLQWLDIHRETERLSDFGLTPEQAMANFHVLDAQGRWQRGAAGFIEVWSHLPGYRRFAALVRGLRLAGPLQALYRPWAAWRLRRRCRLGACERPHD